MTDDALIRWEWEGGAPCRSDTCTPSDEPEAADGQDEPAAAASAPAPATAVAAS